MPDFLFFGDTERSGAMRHELPIAIIDPFLLGIVGGRMHVVASPLEIARIEAGAPGAVVHDMRSLGLFELMGSGMGRYDIDLELCSRAAAAMGVREAIADPDMPVAVADRLRADGIVLRPDAEAVDARKRVKSEPELAGIRRAQAAAEEGMAAGAAVLRRAVADGERLMLDGEPLTAEIVRAAIRAACQERAAPTPPDIIVSSVWQGTGHDPGSGPLPANLPIEIDLWPRDEESGCWGDMTRTFVVGEVPETVRELEALVRQALESARSAVRPGVTGRELHDTACDVFEAAGYPTQRTGPGAGDPDEGFQFSLGHGVGLGVHEAPSLGMSGALPLVAGDVIAVEPGLWRPDIGGVRFEDLLVVTEDGSETLNRYPFDLTP
jgi:Xaa-Pro aminopeptidase